MARRPTFNELVAAGWVRPWGRPIAPITETEVRRQLSDLEPGYWAYFNGDSYECALHCFNEMHKGVLRRGFNKRDGFRWRLA